MFYSTFIVGFEPLVKKILDTDYQEIAISQMLNGGLIYKTSSSHNILNIPFMNNHFFVFKYAKDTNIKQFVDKLNDVKLKKAKRKNSFRIIVSEQNNLISIDYNTLTKLEQKIANETGNYVNRVKPDIEYWILKRSEGIILFMERLNKHKSFDKQLNKGELRDDLCYFLNYLSEANENDIYLDCFCGSGAILKNRMKMKKFNMIFGIDIEKDHILTLKKQYKNNHLIFKNIDFFDNQFNDDFIHKIVTDPPWGIYEKIADIKNFYERLLKESYRILRTKGRLVLLTACKEEVNAIDTKLKLKEKYDILVSGKKAAVYVFEK